MRSEDKQKYNQELRNIYGSLSKELLLRDSDDPEQIKKLNRIIAIFKNFSSDIGNSLERQRNELQRWFRAGKRPLHRENLIKNMFQFIQQKIEEMDIHVIEKKEKTPQSTIIEFKKLLKELLESEEKDKQKIIGQAISVNNDLRVCLRERGITDKEFSNILRYLKGKGCLEGYSNLDDLDTVKITAEGYEWAMENIDITKSKTPIIGIGNIENMIFKKEEVGRDKIEQHGEKSKASIGNKNKEENFLSRIFWKFIIPILVILVAAFLLYRFGIKKP